jgi:hypothetical protein
MGFVEMAENITKKQSVNIGMKIKNSFEIVYG